MIKQQQQQQQQVELQKQQYLASIAPSLDVPLTRKRSSSKTKSNYNPTKSHEKQQASLRSGDLSNFQQQIQPLEHLVWVLKLKSLNGTFDAKTLIVPQSPETLKFGRPGGSKIQSKSTNGFFDSRVLSRNHAELFIDNGKGLFIRDLKSSNGTYINGKQVVPFQIYELKIGDKFDLGSNLENQTAHKKISCEVTDMLLMDLKEYNDTVYKYDQQRQINEKKFFNNAMDALMYGDVVNDMYEDNLLSALATGSDTTRTLENNFSISGLYPSSNIKNVSKLEETISQLLVIINSEFLQNEKLNKIRKFLVQYNENMGKYEELIREKNSEVNSRLQDDLDESRAKIDESDVRTQDLLSKIDSLEKEIQTKEASQNRTKQLIQGFKQKIIQKDEQMSDFKTQIDELKTRYDKALKEQDSKLEAKEEEIRVLKEKLESKEKGIQLNGHEYRDEVFPIRLDTREIVSDSSKFAKTVALEQHDEPTELKDGEVDVDEEQEEDDESNDECNDNKGTKADDEEDKGRDEIAEVPETTALATTKNKSMRTNLVQATIVLAASLLVGATYYQKT